VRDDGVDELDQIVGEPYCNLFGHTRMVPLRDARSPGSTSGSHSTETSVGDRGAVSDARYEPVILGVMKTAISLSDTTFQRVESAARRLGVSRSEFFARAAERWLNDLDDDQTTAAIDRAIAETSTDTAFTDAAAAVLAQSDRV
jgi:predicted DNA-binding protein